MSKEIVALVTPCTWVHHVADLTVIDRWVWFFFFWQCTLKEAVEKLQNYSVQKMPLCHTAGQVTCNCKIYVYPRPTWSSYCACTRGKRCLSTANSSFLVFGLPLLCMLLHKLKLKDSFYLEYDNRHCSLVYEKNISKVQHNQFHQLQCQNKTLEG